MSSSKEIGNLFWDVTRSGRSRFWSGLNRVSHRLLQELAAILAECFKPTMWNAKSRILNLYQGSSRSRREFSVSDRDVFFTPELFSETERPGFKDWLTSTPAKTCAIFHDAIPLKYPEFSWPHAVSRHPHYMKDLCCFDHIFAVSESTRNDLLSYWEWLRISEKPPISVVPLGADFSRQARKKSLCEVSGRKSILMTGILEPRKNQSLLLDVCESLWDEGFQFELNIVGRTNPHFGRRVAQRLRAMEKKGHSVRYHGQVSDRMLEKLYNRASFSVFPSVIEGYGIPVIESLWMGVPVVAGSHIPAVKEMQDKKGVFTVDLLNVQSFKRAIKAMLSDQCLYKGLCRDVEEAKLVTWKESAVSLACALCFGSKKLGS